MRRKAHNQNARQYLNIVLHFIFYSDILKQVHEKGEMKVYEQARV